MNCKSPAGPELRAPSPSRLRVSLACEVRSWGDAATGSLIAPLSFCLPHHQSHPPRGRPVRLVSIVKMTPRLLGAVWMPWEAASSLSSLGISDPSLPDTCSLPCSPFNTPCSLPLCGVLLSELPLMFPR